jgi:hypothetical protein
MKIFLASLSALGFASVLVLLARAEDGGSQGSSGERALARLDAGAPDTGYPPDPPPLITRQRWDVRLAYRSGDVFFRGARRVDLPRPAPTARVFGRFALELYVGRELVDRVRFDFPLLGADELSPANGAVAADKRAPAFAPGLVTQTQVQVPRSDRPTRAAIVDRATGTVWPLPWPLDAEPDAGAPRG